MVLKTDIHKYIGKDAFEKAKQDKQKIVKFMEVIFVDYYVFFNWQLLIAVITAYGI